MKLIKVIAMGLVSVSLLLAFNPPKADASISSLEQQIKQNNEEKKELEKKKEELNSEKDETLKQIGLLDVSIEELNVEVNGLQYQITSLNDKIAENQKSIEKLNEQIDANNLILEKRLRATYKKGGTGYLELILKADSITEALTRIDMVQLIMKDDVDLLKNIEKQKQSVTELVNTQEEQKKEVEANKAQVTSKLAEVKTAQSKKNAYMSNLESDMKSIEAQEARLTKANAEFEKQIQKLQTQSAYVGGSMQWPTAGYYTITSPFGTRVHPIYGGSSFHRGIDISCPYNTPVVAANDGTVIVASSHYSYGNYVIIDHGGQLSTVYAHNTSLAVSVGQHVSKGQVIAYSGSTGESTGPHLHFEVRKNGIVVNPLPYVKGN